MILTIKESCPEVRYRVWLQPDDILIQRGNSIDYVGIAAIYNGKPREYIYPDLMMKIRASSYLSQKYVHLSLNSGATRKYFKSNATGTSGSMPKINQTVLRNTLIPIAPAKEQQRIVSKVDQLLALCEDLGAKLVKGQEKSGRLLEAAVADLLAA